MLTFFIYALLASAMIVPALARLGTKAGVVDRPGGRKQHVGDTPLVGGLGIYVSVLAILSVSGSWSSAHLIAFALLAGAITVIGFLDDVLDVPALSKLAAQFVIAGLAVFWAGATVDDLGGLLGGRSYDLGALAPIVSMVGFVAVINAINLIDGADGVAGGVSCVALAILMLLRSVYGTGFETLEIAAFGALLGFLIFNMPFPWRSRAAVFLGDAGSMLIGFSLAWISVDVNLSAPAVPPIVVASVLAFPVIDMGRVAVTRILRGTGPFTPGRDHFHHLLLDPGRSRMATVLWMMAATTAFAALGIVAWLLGASDLLILIILAIGDDPLPRACVTHAAGRGHGEGRCAALAAAARDAVAGPLDRRLSP